MLQSDVAPPMTNIEAAPRTLVEPSFDAARDDAPYDVQESACEAALNNESKPWSGRVTAAGNDRTPVLQGSRHIENCHTNEEDLIARGIDIEVTESVATYMSTVVKKSLDKTLSTKSPNMQSSIQSVEYNIARPVVLELQRKNATGDLLESHNMKVFNIDAANEVFSKKVLNSSSFMTPIVSLSGVRRIKQYQRGRAVPLLDQRRPWIL